METLSILIEIFLSKKKLIKITKHVVLQNVTKDDGVGIHTLSLFNFKLE